MATNIEKLAVAQALYKRLGPIVSTKDPESLRSKVDDELLCSYEASGQDRMEMRVGGIPVGTLSVRKSKAQTGKRLSVVDPKAFEDWGVENNLCRLVTRAEWFADQDKVLDNALANGEIPNGCELVDVNQPSRALGTTLKIDDSKVEAALNSLGMSAVAYLEGGNGGN